MEVLGARLGTHGDRPGILAKKANTFVRSANRLRSALTNLNGVVLGARCCAMQSDIVTKWPDSDSWLRGVAGHRMVLAIFSRLERCGVTRLRIAPFRVALSVLAPNGDCIGYPSAILFVQETCANNTTHPASNLRGFQRLTHGGLLWCCGTLQALKRVTGFASFAKGLECQ